MFRCLHIRRVHILAVVLVFIFEGFSCVGSFQGKRYFLPNIYIPIDEIRYQSDLPQVPVGSFIALMF